jgi:hypothetical protein
MRTDREHQKEEGARGVPKNLIIAFDIFIMKAEDGGHKSRMSIFDLAQLLPHWLTHRLIFTFVPCFIMRTPPFTALIEHSSQHLSLLHRLTLTLTLSRA